MIRHRTMIRLCAVLACVALTKACGGGESPTAVALPTTLTVSPATAELTALGAAVQFTAEVRDQNGQVMAGAAVTWSSTGVATVDASGLVTAAGNGTATIRARAGEASGTAVVTVMQSVVSVGVSPSAETVTALGSMLQLTAEAFDENGHPVTGTEFSWESSDGAVVTVDASGLVTAAGNGTATITARTGEASGTAVVTVMQSAVSVEVSPSGGRINLGDMLQLTAEAFDENGHPVAVAEFSWESSDATVATVDASGLVTAAGGYGVATITARTGEASGTAVVTVVDLERAALVALYHATDGPNWVNAENWLTDAPVGEWHGVQTGASRRVAGLNLTRNNLTGPIPPELADLTSLGGLNLTRNNLTGPIPPELADLTSLGGLNLTHNNLTGPIPPELADLTSLRQLNLGYNNLTGPIPPELGNLNNLGRLALYRNSLTGPIPPELGNLANLRALELGSNNLTGPIPPELGNLTSLTSLILFTNNFSGPVPPELGDLTSLDWLQLDNNGLTGPIPPELGNLTRMVHLRLKENELTGTIPQSLLALDMLESFYFEENAGLCAPNTAEFVAWLQSIRFVGGPFCSASSSPPR